MLPLSSTRNADFFAALGRAASFEGWTPTNERLAELANTALQLAVSEYEGTRLRTALILARGLEGRMPRGFVQFQAPPPRSSHELRPACAAFPAGLCFREPAERSHAWGGLTVSAHPEELEAAIEFRVRRGFVAVRARGAVLSRLSPGCAPELTPEPRPVLDDLLMQAGFNRAAYGRSIDFETVLGTIDEEGRGGCLLVVPSGVELPELRGLTPMSLPPIAAFTMAATVAETLRNAAMRQQLIEFFNPPEDAERDRFEALEERLFRESEEQLHTHLRAFAKMTRADGAIVLRQDLTLLSAGCRIVSAPAHVPAGEVRSALRPGETSPMATTMGGTRLRSDRSATPG